MPTCAPAKACCCSSWCGGQGCCQSFCGPPVWMAGRAIGISCAVGYSLSLIGTIVTLVYQARDMVNLTVLKADGTPWGKQSCSFYGAVSVSILVVITSVFGIGIYAYGTWACITHNGRHLRYFLYAHGAYQGWFIPLAVCAAGYSRGPRAKDPSLEAACVAQCVAAYPIYAPSGRCPDASRGAGGGGGGGSQPCDQGCVSESESRNSPVAAWIAAALQLIVMLYYGYIIWSVEHHVKNPAPSEVNVPTAMMAVPVNRVYPAAAVVGPPPAAGGFTPVGYPDAPPIAAGAAPDGYPLAVPVVAVAVPVYAPRSTR